MLSRSLFTSLNESVAERAFFRGDILWTLRPSSSLRKRNRQNYRRFWATLSYATLSNDLERSMADQVKPVGLEPLGSKIKRLRQARNLSQDRLAIESHVDQSGLSKFERGKDRAMGRAPLERIAAVLKVTLAELVAGTDHAEKI
jgi:DNA-binding transcriptional regulator YiaG